MEGLVEIHPELGRVCSGVRLAGNEKFGQEKHLLSSGKSEITSVDVSSLEHEGLSRRPV
jgi:hypothetical protein